MPAAGIGLGTARGGAKRLDPDAVAFAATSGATNVAALSKFVKGVKDLGLWNSIVCWPLRSGQNSSTGTTVYSLGGLATYNGTLVNSPTRGTDGLVFASATGHRITTNAVASFLSFGVVYNSTDNSADQIVLSSRNAAAYTNGINWFIRSGVGRLIDVAGVNGAIRVSQSPSLFGVFVFLQATVTAPGSETLTDHTMRRDKESRAVSSGYSFGSGTIATPTTGLVFGSEAYTANRLFNGTVAFGYASTSRLSATAQESLYDLYKAELGGGLSLP